MLSKRVIEKKLLVNGKIHFHFFLTSSSFLHPFSSTLFLNPFPRRFLSSLSCTRFPYPFPHPFPSSLRSSLSLTLSLIPFSVFSSLFLTHFSHLCASSFSFSSSIFIFSSSIFLIPFPHLFPSSLSLIAFPHPVGTTPTLSFSALLLFSFHFLGKLISTEIIHHV
jgi:hypothetical protein